MPDPTGCVVAACTYRTEANSSYCVLHGVKWGRVVTPNAQETAQEGRGGAAGANAYPSAATEVPKTARDDAQTPPGAPETPGGSTETREAQNGSQSPAQPSEV